ncbi:hypothetical protein MPTK1_8g17140 [Marchantia polymorpha subsp. ruderalis]|uniref:Uncharacterized protein n=1 Tax=Marchantia polymorpha TaxID=3197 RepID=A0A2R6X874_MARPO|nr:hypothetical protein MARPO_0030s0046 [Marchantia polymorpha]BBN20185.1 hypothetical protein Mp_8g17140 [Marchantia polymorpha subsp. ruderalis]|eukprot:PTQ42301.1 hypothetical protein MARPO_0030s0046 [Marchantia polymorpha]
MADPQQQTPQIEYGGQSGSTEDASREARGGQEGRTETPTDGEELDEELVVSDTETKEGIVFDAWDYAEEDDDEGCGLEELDVIVKVADAAASLELIAESSRVSW